MNKPGSKGFESADEKFQPAKLSDRERQGQRNANENVLDTGNTYGLGTKFDRADKVTKMGGNYQDFNSEVKGNFADKNESISRLDLVGKSTKNGNTAYNSEPIPETYKCATSNGQPPANAVVYNVEKKNRD